MTEHIRFNADSFVLSGTLHLPDAPAPPVVIGAHGLLSTGDSPKQQALAERLNRCGIAYFRFDHRGCGKSQGEFPDVTTFQGRCRDLAAAIETVLSHPATGTIVGLFGSSMGGAVCLAVAGDFAIRTLVTLAAPVRLQSIRVPHDVETDSALSGMNADKMAFDISDRIEKVSHLLVIHGSADQVVPYRNGEEIYKLAARPKKIVRIEGADHPLTQPCHQQVFMTAATDWFAAGLMVGEQVK